MSNRSLKQFPKGLTKINFVATHSLRKSRSASGSRSAIIVGEAHEKQSSNHSYVIQELIGAGSYGKVFDVKQLGNREASMVIKVMKKAKTENLKEFEVLKSFLGNQPLEKGLPKMIDWGMIDKKTSKLLKVQKGSLFIIQEKYGPSLKEIMINTKYRISTVDVVNVGISLLKIIEKVHEKGYCHTDIKPDNILVAPDNRNYSQRELMLIDFGEATKYQNKDGANSESNKLSEFKGNVVFASHNVLSGCQNSRRDDIIQILFTLVFILDPIQPWIFDEQNQLQSFEEIKRQKLTQNPKQLFQKQSIQILIPALEEAYSIAFNEKPNYRKLQFLLQKILLQANIIPSCRFSWTNQNRMPNYIFSSQISNEDMTEYEKEQANTDEGRTDFEKWKKAQNHDLVFQKVSFPLKNKKN